MHATILNAALPLAFAATLAMPASAAAQLPSVTNQRLYDWLVSQQAVETGLIESFAQPSDACLSLQAALYDQAIAGIASCQLGDCDLAVTILEFHEKMWNAGNGLANFYSIATGAVGMENAVHAGPNLWIGLLALQYGALTGRNRFDGFALDVARWAAALPHIRGAIAMGPRDDAGVRWTRIAATEHQLDYFALLRGLDARTAERERRWIRLELEGVERFLRLTVYDSARGAFVRGFRAPDSLDPAAPAGRDTVAALDAQTWAIAAIGPATLSSWGIDPERLIRYSEQNFGVTVTNIPGIAALAQADRVDGFDFTNAAGAAAAGRGRMISPEWTGEMINAYVMVGRDILSRPAAQRTAADETRARAYLERARHYTGQLDRIAIHRGETSALPYATLPGVLTFADGWRTPDLDAAGRLVGSVAGTAWRVFAGSFNPLQPGDWLAGRPERVRRNAATARAAIPDAAYLPSSCRSDGLTAAALTNLAASRFAQAIAFGEQAIMLARDSAIAQQTRKALQGGLIHFRPGGDSAKHAIFGFGALNDAGGAAFAVASAGMAVARQSADNANDGVAAGFEARATRALRLLVDSVPLAQVWDPAGWFWVPAHAARWEYPEQVGRPGASAILAAGGTVWVYRDQNSPEHVYAPSRWMGDIEDIEVDEADTTAPYSGRTAARISYRAQGPLGRAAVAWEFPAGPWSGPPGGLDLTGGRRLVLMARGLHGGERVRFMIGGTRGRFPDSLFPPRSTGMLTLSQEYQRVVLPLDGDLSNIVAALIWSAEHAMGPSTILIDDVRIEGTAR